MQWSFAEGSVTISLNKPVGGPLAWSCVSQLAHLLFHQALGSGAYHLAQDIRVGGLLDEGAQVHHVVGYRRVLGCVCVHNPAGHLQEPFFGRHVGHVPPRGVAGR